MNTAIDHLAALTGHRDRDQLDVTLAHALMDLLQPHSVRVYKLVGDSTDQRWLLRARLDQGNQIAQSDPGWIEFADLPPREAFPLRSQALDAEKVTESAEQEDRMTLFPVIIDGKSSGVIEIFTSSRLGGARQRIVSSILRIYRNFESLLNYSEHDTLTGLLNRKTFDLAFLRMTKLQSAPLSETASAAEIERRNDAALVAQTWLGVLDIDHFKLVNDNFGHLIGDEVLLLVARILRSTFRFQDQLYRFGGEEFVILLRCNNEEDAIQAFERLRHNMASYPFPQVGNVTASIGITAVKPATDTPSAAFERADRAVYHAKQHGRNQVCSHADLVRRGLLDDGTKTGDVELF